MHHKSRRVAAPWLGVSLLALNAVCGAPAGADLTLGGNSRAFAMGGAGVAVVDRSERSSPVNPAALALLNRRVKIGLPHAGVRASGLPIRAAYKHLFENPDETDAVTLARDFGQRDSNFGVRLAWGLRVGHMDAAASGIAQARVLPNQALKDWARNANGNAALLTGAERADFLGAGSYNLPEIGFAERVSPSGSPILMEVGGRLKFSRAVYSHYIVTAANIQNNTPAVAAPELGGGTTLTQDGIGLDFGVLMHPRDHNGLSTALVVTNIIEPHFRFTGTDVNGNPVNYNLQPRSVTVGTAYEASSTPRAALPFAGGTPAPGASPSGSAGGTSTSPSAPAPRSASPRRSASDA
jgi:hypothetical protein